MPKGQPFNHYDLGHLESGRVVEISLSGNAANVLLLDSSNFQNYKRNKRYQYIGGLAKRSPVRLKTNKSSHWHVVVNMNGLAGTVRSGVTVIPPLLPEIHHTGLSPEEIRDAIDLKPDTGNVNYDVFISHASEDKELVVRPLAERLRNLGLRVWYDEFEMRIGDSLRRKIDQGIANSRFGVVVLSESFIAKGWTAYELDGIVALNVKNKQRLLPIWHKISSEGVMAFSPTLADRVALTTEHNSVEELAEKIFEAIRI